MAAKINEFSITCLSLNLAFAQKPNVQKNEDSSVKSAPTVYSFQKVQKAVEDIPVPQPAKNIFTEDVDPALLLIDDDKPFIKGYAFD
ncbi:hypothetical protein HDV04_000824 [Boothiomyces sp. JEL0838]|nr:hypothetical protein HDV04_000824 [Boothiomyces sp. JEL0838]